MPSRWHHLLELRELSYLSIWVCFMEAKLTLFVSFSPWHDFITVFHNRISLKWIKHHRKVTSACLKDYKDKYILWFNSRMCRGLRIDKNKIFGSCTLYRTTASSGTKTTSRPSLYLTFWWCYCGKLLYFARDYTKYETDNCIPAHFYYCSLCASVSSRNIYVQKVLSFISRKFSWGPTFKNLVMWSLN